MAPSAQRAPGRPPWASGHKGEVFAEAVPDWQDAKKKGVGFMPQFYDNFTKQFIAGFGWFFPYMTEDKVFVKPTTESWRSIQDTTGLDQDEKARRDEYYNKLRERVVGWWGTYNSKLSKEDDKTAQMDIKTTLTKINKTLPKPPRRTRMSQFYSRTYLHQRSGVDVQKLWVDYQAKPVGPGEKQMKYLDFVNKLAAEWYEKETPQFKEWLKAEREKEHIVNLKEYQDKMKAIDVLPDDAPSYHKALLNAAAFMQPLCDLTAKKFGGAVTMLVVLPVETGSIEMRSVHSGKTNGLTPKLYPEFDPPGFRALEESFVNFGHQVFSQTERDQRVLWHAMEEKDEQEDDDDIAGSNDAAEAGTTMPSLPTPPGTSSSPSPTPNPTPAQTLPSPSASPPVHPSAPLHPLLPPSPPIAASPLLSPVSLLAALPAPSRPLVLPPAASPVIAPLQQLPSQAPAPIVTPLIVQQTPTPAPAAPTPTPSAPTPAPSAPTPAPSAPTPAPSTPTAASIPSSPSDTAIILAPAHLNSIPPDEAAAFAGVLAVAEQWGSTWAELVATFIQFERDADFTSKKFQLPRSDLRPKCLKVWFDEKRPMVGTQWEEHAVGDGTAFGEEWWTWWTSIQPAQTAEGAQDWGRLCKPGPTGIFLVLVTLVWWRKMLGDADSPSWANAVTAVDSALKLSRASAAIPKLQTKRKRSPVEQVALSDVPAAKKRAPKPTLRLLGIA
ncbi:hypothetical protein HWV62_15923 [Athelia sp. TMB]|nr:hypothetical protein HWV62_15923 [Athelia sp. TMB]